MLPEIGLGLLLSSILELYSIFLMHRIRSFRATGDKISKLSA
jgi:hypothetical protein